MTDLILSVVSDSCRTLWGAMADLADKIDDLICSFEGGGDSAMDTLAMLVFGWTVLALFVLAIAKYVYARFVKKSAVPADVVKAVTVSTDAAKTDTATPVVKPEVKSVPAAAAAPTRRGSAGGRVGNGGKFVSPTPPLRKRLSAKGAPSPVGSARPGPGVTLPTVTGPDPEAVRWVNELLYWLYSDGNGLEEIVNVWIATLNELAKKSVEEVCYRISKSYMEVLDAT